MARAALEHVTSAQGISRLGKVRGRARRGRLRHPGKALFENTNQIRTEGGGGGGPAGGGGGAGGGGPPRPPPPPATVIELHQAHGRQRWPPRGLACSARHPARSSPPHSSGQGRLSPMTRAPMPESAVGLCRTSWSRATGHATETLQGSIELRRSRCTH